MPKAKEVESMPAKEDGKEKESRSQKSVTIAPKVLADFEEVAEALDVPIATFLSEILRQYHRSQEFSSLLSRVRQERNRR